VAHLIAVAGVRTNGADAARAHHREAEGPDRPVPVVRQQR
jgi:hypothetical protein